MDLKHLFFIVGLNLKLVGNSYVEFFLSKNFYKDIFYVFFYFFYFCKMMI